VSQAAGRGDTPFSARIPLAEILRYCLDNHRFGLDGWGQRASESGTTVSLKKACEDLRIDGPGSFTKERKS
jgi:hypothetical protein